VRSRSTITDQANRDEKKDVLRLGLDDVHHAVLVGSGPPRTTKPASTSPSMKDACAGQSESSSSGRDGFPWRAGAAAHDNERRHARVLAAVFY
jgi:hypothetical protein